MTRYRPPARRWRVGEQCQVPWYNRRAAGRVGGWSGAEVVAVRGDRVVVRRYRWESEHPWWELRARPVLAHHRGLLRVS